MPWNCDSFRVRVPRENGGFINYLLIFAENGIIAAKIGKTSEYDDAGVGGAYFGVIGAMFGAKSKQRHREKLEAESIKLKELTMEQILSLGRENFQIAYADIDTARIKEGSNYGIGALKLEGNVTPVLTRLGLGTLTGLFHKKTRRDIDFHVEYGQDFERCRTMVSKALHDKFLAR